jgi:hypothetical protein
MIRRVHEKTGDSLAYFLRRKTPGEQQQGDKERSVAVPVYEVKGKTARRFCVQFVGQSPLDRVTGFVGKESWVKVGGYRRRHGRRTAREKRLQRPYTRNRDGSKQESGVSG